MTKYILNNSNFVLYINVNYFEYNYFMKYLTWNSYIYKNKNINEINLYL